MSLTHTVKQLIIHTILLLVLLENLAIAHAASVIRGPYLQIATPHSMVVRWRTDTATDSRVRFGTTQANLNLTADALGYVTEHEVLVTGLNPDTRYYYSVGSSSQTLAGDNVTTFFETSPVVGASRSTRIWVIGDAGTTNSDQAAVYNAYQNYTGSTHTNLWLMLGYNAYNTGTDSEYQAAVFAMYPEMLRSSPVWSTLGNHDGQTADSASETGPYYDIFSFPRNAEAGGLASGTEAYYSFEYGNIHFISLDSYESNRSVGSPMLTWLENDLAATIQPWIIVIWHHPPYTKGSHNSDTETNLIQMRENVLPILDNYGVDLVLSGHSHSYERSYLLDGHYGNSGTFSTSHQVDAGSGQESGTGVYQKNVGANHSGVVYTVAGSSGKTSGGSLNHPAMFMSLNQLGSVVLDVNGNRLDAQFVNSSGAVTDNYTIVKGDDTMSPTIASSEATGASRVSVIFNEAINPLSAENIVNYTISDGVSIVSAKVDVDSRTVLLTTSSLTLGSSYTVTVNNVTDVADNPVAINTQSSFSYLDTQTASFQNGVAPSASYIGTTDSTIEEGNPTANFGTAADIRADGDDGGGVDVSSLLRFDLSSIPVDVRVDAVTLKLEVFNVSGNTYQVQRLLPAWNESEITWIEASSGVTWTSSGADGASDRDSTILGNLLGSSTGRLAIDLNADGIAVVQGWVNGSLPNNGFIISGTSNTDGLDMHSSDYAIVDQRPELNVTYSSGGTASDTEAPTVPTGMVSSNVTETSVTLNWQASSDNVAVAGYRIRRDEQVINSVTDTSYADSVLTASTAYSYTVEAFDAAGNYSGESMTEIVISLDPPTPTLTEPNAPSAILATAQSWDSITLSWTDSADNEDNVEIEYSLDGANWFALVILAANATTYTNSGLAELTTYNYRVRTVNAAGPSAYSNVASATTSEQRSITTVELRDGLNGYIGTTDTYVASGKPNDNWGSSSSIIADGDGGSRDKMIMLLRWDLNGIPTDVSVADVKLTLYI